LLDRIDIHAEVLRVDYEKLSSARAHHRALKLACTIANLVGSEHIQTAHIAEAIQYRPRRMV
jgi:predicted ATPase with chaperone activity